jgi:hypothetical protein
MRVRYLARTALGDGHPPAEGAAPGTVRRLPPVSGTS